MVSGTHLNPTPRLARVIGPTAIQVTANADILLADLTDVAKSQGILMIMNNGPDTIYYCLHTSSTASPGVTTANGIPIVPGGQQFLDNIGGTAVWARTTVLQVTPADTRISGAKT